MAVRRGIGIEQKDCEREKEREKYPRNYDEIIIVRHTKNLFLIGTCPISLASFVQSIELSGPS